MMEYFLIVNSKRYTYIKNTFRLYQQPSLGEGDRIVKGKLYKLFTMDLLTLIFLPFYRKSVEQIQTKKSTSSEKCC